jgi:LDH2 family malate/lactate/ureidoglycolate dehydrogenase
MADFKVPLDQAIFVKAEPLAATVTSLMQAAGLSAEDAALAADVLVRADLRGVDTHGVSNMLRSYIDRLRAGDYNARAELRVVREAPATATLDSDNGLGVVIAPKAMRIALDKAAAVGVGMVSVGHGRHLGMAAYHAMLALPRDMIGICMTACGPSMVPTWGRETRVGTNPIAVAVPCGDEPDFVYDGATTAIAGNKVNNARRNGQPLPPGLLADPEGRPVPDAVLAPPPGEVRLLPLGSTYETGGHKGYGLSLMAHILGGTLTGGAFSPLRNRTQKPSDPDNIGHFFLALNPAAFRPADAFRDDLDAVIDTLHATRPADPALPVLVPGDPEHATRADRLARGIPLPAALRTQIRAIAEAAGAPCMLG